MKTIIQLFLPIALAFLGCSAAPNDTRQKEEGDIHETVFRYLFEHNPSVLQKQAKAYYLGIGEKTSTGATDEFLKRFADHNPPVYKRSSAAVSPDQGVTDKETGERGLIFRLYGVKWVSDSEAELDGGFYEIGNNSGLVNTYTLKKISGKWTVTKSTGFRTPIF